MGAIVRIIGEHSLLRRGGDGFEEGGKGGKEKLSS